MVYAHRFAYSLRNGSISADQVIRHRCDNPLCCNPAHLASGTQADNVRDAVDRDRHAKGEAVSSAILRVSDIPRIRRRISSGERHKEIAASFGVCRSTISQIARGATWNWA